MTVSIGLLGYGADRPVSHEHVEATAGISIGLMYDRSAADMSDELALDVDLVVEGADC